MRAREQPSAWGWRVSHLAAWLLALLSKEAAIVLPLAYLVHGRWVERRAWREAAAPWLVAGWAFGLAVYLMARRAALPEGLGLAGLSAAALARAPWVIAGDLAKL